MLRLLLMALVGITLMPGIFAAPPFGDGFATGKLEDYLEKVDPKQIKIVLNKVEGMKGKATLTITDLNKVQFKPVPVSPNAKYTLEFRGCFTGGESIEENPRLDVALMPRGSLAILPSHGIEFLDAEKKKIVVRHPHPIYSGLPFRQWHDYTDVFYTPANAAFLILNVQSANGITFSMDNIKLEKTPDEGSLTVNPDFKYGFYNYSGWSQLAAGARMVLTKEGRPALSVQYGSIGSWFPISEPGTYQPSVKCTPNGYAATVELSLFDKDGKLTAASFRVGDKIPFILPPGTVCGGFMVRSVVLEELRLIRIGDESKIEEFRKK